MGVEAHENGGQTDEAVHDRHKLGHLGHLNPRGELVAHRRTRRDQDQRHEPEAGTRPDQRGDDRDGHADDAVPDRAFRAFLSRQSPPARG
jgi:hypothetical protein